MRKKYLVLLLWIVPFQLLFSETDWNPNSPEPAVAEPVSKKDKNEVHLDLGKAEELFWKNNLLLLAAKFQVDVKKAGVLQAGLYANPTIGIDQVAYAESQRSWFDATRAGQTVYQVQQLFLLGDKIGKRVKVAELDAKITEQEFYDIARGLHTKLRRTLYSTFYLHQAMSFYDKSISTLERTVVSGEKAYERRAILLAELLRLKALLFFLKKEREDLRIKIFEKEADLRVLLNDDSMRDANISILPDLQETTLERLNPSKLQLNDLLDKARENRPDLKIAIQNLKYEEANLELQYANAIPNLSLGPKYDRNGTGFKSEWSITANLEVPIFNRNQGNIEASQKAILVRKQEIRNKILEMENEISVAHRSAKVKDDLYRKFMNTYVKDYHSLSLDVVSSYERRYIGIIEFADFFETYRSSVVEILRLQTDRMESFEEINYTTGFGLLVPRLENGNNNQGE
ncbi:TolC family protein [Leptospira congkakensis]|uniref:TolC family protein n=1 Tax=Leptospira congkakensis TaxID=2484932 RepID=A0A4Z1A7Z9_9LEPT|nr:TolC family protein [Leptospira congkakensis]TGL85181.1 TolC family protein [Leptospira congkakensis]TGL92891.1 TolC family protein [Leptospira congkakensis]TGL95629.1 TolC family protein [Leptospira congkakensis]